MRCEVKIGSKCRRPVAGGECYNNSRTAMVRMHVAPGAASGMSRCRPHSRPTTVGGRRATYPVASREARASCMLPRVVRSPCPHSPRSPDPPVAHPTPGGRGGIPHIRPAAISVRPRLTPVASRRRQRHGPLPAMRPRGRRVDLPPRRLQRQQQQRPPPPPATGAGFQR